jgi:hypothetical protein
MKKLVLATAIVAMASPAFAQNWAVQQQLNQQQLDTTVQGIYLDQQLNSAMNRAMQANQDAVNRTLNSNQRRCPINSMGYC